ncbi:hypothetical protein FIBSPDRAFT_557916 [Athelia psychrophila]|uniref:Uncharacterized protein n=1 Tax=Athelia psychrophila TaxID=1759441 RepID=A0A166IEG9_9AGAM|nr:hypothetical protein FIBSPDRAFT_557916 [Fibularhizoctonia sp. CBS 109695]
MLPPHPPLLPPPSDAPQDLLKLIYEEDEAKRIKLAAAAPQRRTALSNRKSPLTQPIRSRRLSINDAVRCLVALRPPEQTAGLQFTTISRSIPDPPKPANVDPLAKERRRRLRELSEQTFPDGNVPEPFSLTSLALSQDIAAKGPGLPVILATGIVATNATDTSQCQIQPASINYQLPQVFPEADGQIDLVSWRASVGGQVIPL